MSDEVMKEHRFEIGLKRGPHSFAGFVGTQAATTQEAAETTVEFLLALSAMTDNEWSNLIGHAVRLAANPELERLPNG